MKRLMVVLGLVIAMGLGGGLVSPVHAAASKFTHANNCPWFMPPEWGAGRSLTVQPMLGRWMHESGDGTWTRCMDQFNTRFRPSVRNGFTAKVTWRKGKDVIKRQRRHVANTSNDYEQFTLRSAKLRRNKDGYWTIGGKVVSARVAFVKKGYRTKVVVVKRFRFPAE